MPLAQKAIKQKIKSVGSIKKITKTMEMVSISKMRRSVDKALASRAYSHYALELLVNLSKDKDVSNPLMLVPQKAGVANKELIVVIASSKGLCGGYHTNLFKALSSYVKSDKAQGKVFNAITIGKYGEKICKKLSIPTFASFNTFSEYSTIEQTKELSDLVRREYEKGEYDSVKILYTEFLKSTTYKPVLREIFPISVSSIENILDAFTIPAPAEALLARDYSKNIDEKVREKNINSDLTDYQFEPDLNEILESILPGLVDVVFYQTLAEAFASEHSARMFAMKNAGDSATTILDALMLSYNHARQDGITRELSEIVAGAEALNIN
ncbi:MAG: ATP synthase F1 subunit gamma [Candidatus Woesebacteria bacterium]|nr:ATP synthase F1 subunit gamma [Candidatus Woesebacteria bacterium]